MTILYSAKILHLKVQIKQKHKSKILNSDVPFSDNRSLINKLKPIKSLNWSKLAMNGDKRFFSSTKMLLTSCLPTIAMKKC